MVFRVRRPEGVPTRANRRQPTVRSERLKCSGFSADCLQPRVVFCCCCCCCCGAKPAAGGAEPPRGEGEAGPRAAAAGARGCRVLSRRCPGTAGWGGREVRGHLGCFLPALPRRCSRPLMRVSVLVPGPAPAAVPTAGREPPTPGAGAVAAASGAAVPGSVQLALSVLHALLYAALFAFAYLQLWRLLLYRERRLSYQSLCLFLCLAWAALRTTLFSAAFSLSGSLPVLRPPSRLHFFPHWLLYCFPSCLQFSTLCLLNLYLAEVRREDRRAGERGRRDPLPPRPTGEGWGERGGEVAGEQPGDTEALRSFPSPST